MITPLISIIIVNHNGMEYIADCLDSISKRVPLSHEVIVVDNASTDGSADLIRSMYAGVRLIQSRKNLGFARANNTGAKAAAGEYLLLLNQDTVLLSDLTPALRLLEQNHGAGIAGAKMVDGKGRYRPSAGYFPSPLRLVRISSLYVKDGGFVSGDFPAGTKGSEVDWVEGSFMLVKSSLWRAAGGLDGGFFMYGEDVDFCKTAAGLGYSTLYCPDVSYVHHGRYEPSRLPMVIKGFLRFHKKHSGPLVRMAAKAVLYAGLGTRVLLNSAAYVVTGSPARKTSARACWSALRHAG